MLETIIAGIAAFAGTNIDDMFIDTLFFARAETKRQVRSVIIGKYLGIGALVGLSVLGGYVLHAVATKYVGLLGLVPIALGVREWRRGRRAVDGDDREGAPDLPRGFALSVAIVTVSNGADNIGVYMPLFAGYTAGQTAAVILVFALMTGLWCLLGKKLADLPGLRGFLMKYRAVTVPAVLIVLGIYIILKSIL